jgi:hypothetical protein
MKESLNSKVVSRSRVRPLFSHGFPVNEYYTENYTHAFYSNRLKDSSDFHEVLSQTLDETTDELDSEGYASENYFPPQHCFNYSPEPV